MPAATPLTTPLTSPDTTPGPGWPAATQASAAASSTPVVPVATARWSNTDRVVAREYATSAGSRPGRASIHRARALACAARPAAVRPDIGHAAGVPVRTG